MLLTTLALIGVLIAALYLYWRWNFNHWHERALIGPKPSYFTGNLPHSINQKRHMAYDVDDIYRAYKSKADFVGVFMGHAPCFLVINPTLIHKVFVNDFKHFQDNEFTQMVTEKSDFIFANNAFSLTGSRWKDQRTESSPGLSHNRIKIMYPTTLKNCQRLIDFIREQTRAPPTDGLDTGDICLRFTSDLVTDWTLGLDAASFSKNPTPIMGNIQNLFHFTPSVLLYFFAVSLFPKVRDIWKIRFIPKPVERFFVSLTEDALKMRQNEKDVKRYDFLAYMLEVQGKKKLTPLQLTAHSMSFLLDGFETTATVLSHTLLLLARNGEAQEKLRTEISEHFGETAEIDFEVLVTLPYLNACIHEALRIFPPVFASSKLCTEPIEWTNKDGSTMHVRKGDVIQLPLYSVMNDEEFYPNPQQFMPERMLEDNGGLKEFKQQGLYYGFGDGPRVCLGMRFALANIKTALAEIIRTFEVSVNPKTRTDNLFDAKHIVTRIDGGIYLDYKARN